MANIVAQPLTVADILARTPRPVLSPDETVDLGRKAWAFLAAGADQVEMEISLFATADMLNAAIVAFLRAELAAGRSPFVPAHLAVAS